MKVYYIIPIILLILINLSCQNKRVKTHLIIDNSVCLSKELRTSSYHCIEENPYIDKYIVYALPAHISIAGCYNGNKLNEWNIYYYNSKEFDLDYLKSAFHFSFQGKDFYVFDGVYRITNKSDYIYNFRKKHIPIYSSRIKE